MARPTSIASMPANPSMAEGAGNRASRHVIVLAVAALHALAIWLLSSHLATTIRPQRVGSTVLTLLLTETRPERKPTQATVGATSPVIRIPLKRPPAGAMPPTEPIAITLTSPPKSDEPIPEPAAGLSQRALDGVGKAVGDLRKEGLLPDIGKPEHKPDRFEKAIASAARVTETTTETFTGNDGHVITRVSGPGGTYCVMTTLDSDPDGIDRGQRGLAIKKVHCSH